MFQLQCPFFIASAFTLSMWFRGIYKEMFHQDKSKRLGVYCERKPLQWIILILGVDMGGHRAIT